MKWLSLIIGIIIIAAAAWLLFKPSDANGPAPESQEAQETEMMEGAEGESMDSGEMQMEDGTLDASVDVSAAVGAGSADEPEPQGDPIFHALVEYTDSGFSPATVTVSQGETVRFVNNSSRGVWVGGDNHPTHGIYPEVTENDCLGTSFDTCRTLQAGEFWEFTFNHKGEWGYHNHVRASEAGTVVVN